VSESATAPRVKAAWGAVELLATVFPEPAWAVPGVLPEGLNLIVSPPKVGKSWFALGLAVAVASGGTALGRIEVAQGDVLYAALEDTPRRLQRRLRTVLGSSAPPGRLTFVTECARLDEGGLEHLQGWLERHPESRLLIVDVFAKVRGGARRNVNAYDGDYEAMAGLKRLADEHSVCVLVVHHTRKQADGDFLQTVSGTNGIAGSADTLLVLSRTRSSADAVLQITGRDVEEAEHPLQFDAQRGQWLLMDGPASDYALGDTRQAILRGLRELTAARSKDLAEHLKISNETVRKTLNRMAKDGQIDGDGRGTFWPLDVHRAAVPAVPGVPTAAGGDGWDSWDSDLPMAEEPPDDEQWYAETFGAGASNPHEREDARARAQ
jgi:hypothetical protein